MQYNRTKFAEVTNETVKKTQHFSDPTNCVKKPTYAASWHVRVRSASFVLVETQIYVRSLRRNFLVENRFGREQKRSITEV